MSMRQILLLTICAATFHSLSGAHAQDVFGPPASPPTGGGGYPSFGGGDYLERTEREVSNYVFDDVSRQLDGSSQAGLENNDEQIDIFGPTNPEGVFDSNGDSSARQEELARRALPSGDRLYDLTPVNPDQGVTQVMDSSTYNSMMSSSLSRNNTIYLTTLNMVEPAVAAALGTSVQTGLSYYQQIMNAETNLTTQLESAPELRDWALQIYYNCVAKKTKEFSGNRIKAQEYCQKSFSPKDSPDHPDNLDVAFMDDGFVGPPSGAEARTSIPSGERENYIALSDIIFNQAINYNSSVRAGTDQIPFNDSFGSERQQNAIALKSSFLDYFGDFLIRINIESGTEGASGVKHALRMVRVAPKRPAQQEMPIITEQIYDSIQALMYQRCQLAWSNSVPAGYSGGPEGPPAPGSNRCVPGMAPNEFAIEECGERWNTGLAKDSLREISVPGFQPSAPFADTLWRAYVSINGVVQNNRVGCDLLDKSKSAIYVSASAARNGSAGTDQSGISEFHRISYTVARRLARARMLGRFIQGYRSVMALASAGSKDALAGRYASQLIFDAAGTNDLTAAYRQNLRDLEKYLAEHSKKYANTVGRGTEQIRPNSDGGGRTGASTFGGGE